MVGLRLSNRRVLSRARLANSRALSAASCPRGKLAAGSVRTYQEPGASNPDAFCSSPVTEKRPCQGIFETARPRDRRWCLLGGGRYKIFKFVHRMALPSLRNSAGNRTGL